MRDIASKKSSVSEILKNESLWGEDISRFEKEMNK